MCYRDNRLESWLLSRGIHSPRDRFVRFSRSRRQSAQDHGRTPGHHLDALLYTRYAPHDYCAPVRNETSLANVMSIGRRPKSLVVYRRKNTDFRAYRASRKSYQRDTPSRRLAAFSAMLLYYYYGKYISFPLFPSHRPPRPLHHPPFSSQHSDRGLFTI